MLTAPQHGTQGGRRIIGEYTVTEKDMETDEVFTDTIAVVANNDFGEILTSTPLFAFRTAAWCRNGLTDCWWRKIIFLRRYHQPLLQHYPLLHVIRTGSRDGGVTGGKRRYPATHVDYRKLQANLKKQASTCRNKQAHGK
jgi:hypothetical protein